MVRSLADRTFQLRSEPPAGEKAEPPVRHVVDLTPSTWNEVVVESKKHVFVKFYAPWCSHCKRLKPDWDKLGEEYADSERIVIAAVDCTAEGKELCNEVKGFPTIKTYWGHMSTDYAGSFDFAALKDHVDGFTDPSVEYQPRRGWHGSEPSAGEGSDPSADDASEPATGHASEPSARL